MADDKENTVVVHVGDSSDENRQGGAGVDVMDLGGGDDTANTGGGFMNVNLGGSGADNLTGQGVLDFVLGGSGDDTLTGGTGADTFFFWEGHGTDTIKDFSTADGDKINLIAFDKTITWDQVSTKITTVTDENSVVTGVRIDLGACGGTRSAGQGSTEYPTHPSHG